MKTSNPLNRPLLDMIKLASQRAETIASLQEVLHAALELLHDYNATIDRLRAENRRLREQMPRGRQVAA